MIDRSTRWLEALPVKDLEAATAADTLVAGWIARFGVPADITSDRGTQFCSQVWRAMCEKLGITHHTTTAYHPASNGMVERAHRQVKEALRARAAQNDWPAHLSWVLLGLRTAPKEDSLKRVLKLNDLGTLPFCIVSNVVSFVKGFGFFPSPKTGGG